MPATTTFHYENRREQELAWPWVALYIAIYAQQNRGFDVSARPTWWDLYRWNMCEKSWVHVGSSTTYLSNRSKWVLQQNVRNHCISSWDFQVPTAPASTRNLHDKHLQNVKRVHVYNRELFLYSCLQVFDVLCWDPWHGLFCLSGL